MREALREAIKAYFEFEVPVGCVIVKDGRIIAKAHNMDKSLPDVTAHAEIAALRDASKNLGTNVLEECEMYVSLEPCLMCSGAILNSRIGMVYIGAANRVDGAFVSRYPVIYENLDRLKLEYKFIKTISPYLLKRFFKKLRKKAKN